MTQPRAEETRSRILDAAEECFADQGYDAVGVAEICRRAGVTKGGFYHHFPTKQAVFLALLERWLVALDAALAALRTGAPSVPEELLQMAGMAQVIFHEARGRLPMFMEFWNKAARDPAIWEATVHPYRRYTAFFAEIVRAGIAEGSLRPVDPEIAAQAIVSLAVGLVLQGLMDPQGADWGRVMRESFQMLLEGLKRKELE